MNQKFVQDIHIQGVSQHQKLNQMFNTGSTSQKLIPKDQPSLLQRINNNESSNQKYQSVQVGQQQQTNSNNMQRASQVQQKRNQSREQQQKNNQQSPVQFNGQGLNKSLSKTKMNFREKIQQYQHQHQLQQQSQFQKTQMNFSTKVAGQFEVNLSSLNNQKKEAIDDLKCQSEKNNIDYSRFTKKEAGKKMLSQSQLLFDQLRKKTQNNNLNSSSDIGKIQDLKKESNATIIQQQNIISQQSIPILSDRVGIGYSNNSLTLSNYQQKCEEQVQGQKVQDLKNNSLFTSKFSQDEQLSPLRKVNKSNKSFQQLDAFTGSKDNLGQRIISEQLSSANFSEKVTSPTSFTQFSSPHQIKQGKGIFFKSNHSSIINGVINSQISNIESFQEQQSIKSPKRQKQPSVSLINQNSLMDKISKNIQKNQEDYKRTTLKLLDKNKEHELTSPINLLSNNLESNGLIQRQKEILNGKSLKKRSGTMINLKELQAKYNLPHPNKEQILFSNDQNNNENQLQKRIENKIELKIPQSPYRKNSANSFLNNNSQDFSSYNVNSQIINQQRLQSEDSPISTKMRRSQFRQKSQILFPQIQQNLSQQDIQSPLSYDKNMMMVASTVSCNNRSVNNIVGNSKQKLTPSNSQRHINILNQNLNQNKGIIQYSNNNDRESKNKSTKQQYIVPQSYNQTRNSYQGNQQIPQTAYTDYNINLSAHSPTHIIQFNNDDEDPFFSLQNLNIIKTTSQFVPNFINQSSNILNSNQLKKNNIKSGFDKSQDYINVVDDSPQQPKERISSNEDFTQSVQQSSLMLQRSQNQNMVRSHDNLLQLAQNKNQMKLNQFNNNFNNNTSLPNINNNLIKNKNYSQFLKINQKFSENSSNHSSNELSPIYPLKSSYSKRGFSYYSQQIEKNDKDNLNQIVASLLIDYFQYQQLRLHSEKLQNIHFRAQSFVSFINNILLNEEEDTFKSIISKQKPPRKESSIKLGYAKEQLKLIGITPILLPYLVEEIIQKLNDLVEQSKQNTLDIQINTEYVEKITEKINNYIKQNIHWTLLDQLGSEQNLQNISKQLLEVFNQDPLCLKFLNIFKIDENNFYKIVYSAFQNDFIEEHLFEEVKNRMIEYSQSNNGNPSSSSPSSSSSSSSDMTYADFFYIKYKIMYFCLQQEISLKIIFTLMEILEKLRYYILKKPHSIESINFETVGFQLKTVLSNNSKIHQILQEKNISTNKFEQILGNLTLFILNKSISFYPINKLPQQLDAIFSADYDTVMQISNGLLKLLQTNYKCEKHVILDAKLVLSTIKVASGIKQSFNSSLNSQQTISFENILTKLLTVLEENQIFTQYTSLSNPLNLKLFILNLLCYLFDIFIDDQQCRIYTLDIQAQFKMFGCNFVAFNDFLIQVHNVLQPYLPPGYLQDFVLNSCKDMKGLDIFD